MIGGRNRVYKIAVFDAFLFQPFRYIRKEYAARELNPALRSALQTIENRAGKFIMLKSLDRSIINVRKTIKELCAEIGSENFVLFHRGAAVHVRYITICSANDVTLENNINWGRA